MLNNLLFSRTVTPDLEKSMNVYSLRHKVLSNNIANVMTPGYQAKRVSFEAEYRQSLYADTALRLTTTSDGHMAVAHRTFSHIHPKVEYRNRGLNDSGLNNVDIEREMAEMAENNLRYEMSTKLINKRFMNIKSAIRSR
jgi:flagellar basal-body rod protein FlgB